MIIKVVAMSNCNWPGFVEFCQTNGLPNPKSSVSDTRIARTPAAYAASLSFDGDGLSNLTTGLRGFDHGFLTVICKLDGHDTMVHLATTRNLVVKVIESQKRIVLVSASYLDWYRNIVEKLRYDDRDELSLFYTSACLLLEAHGFRELFRQHPRTMDDGIFTFI
jgi:hypothetical protein